MRNAMGDEIGSTTVGYNGSPAVVLVHGFLGFSHIRFLGLDIPYFRKVAEALRPLGVSPHFPAVPPTDTVASRGEALANFLARLDAERIILIGHSMGGLDSRFLIHHLDPDRRVRALITLSTPHRGSPVARWCLESRGFFQDFAKRSWGAALRDITPEACSLRNETLTDREDVLYSSYAAARAVNEQPFWLRSLGRLIEREEGENDGFVAVASSRWGDFRGTLRADHLELAGWSMTWSSKRYMRPFPHAGFYRRIVEDVLSKPLKL